jgi:regulator of replication initiation timing
MAKDHIREASLVELTDEDLKEVIGSTYTKLRNTEEQKKANPEVIRLQDELSNLLKPYNEAIRTCKARLKAARCIANSRGLVWRDLANVETE